uniref:Uncharacterized protein n=1 Tax=Arion vulgaris TaxID=1028688 RepID=A0A0B6ZSK5_9EUPU
MGLEVSYILPFLVVYWGILQSRSIKDYLLEGVNVCVSMSSVLFSLQLKKLFTLPSGSNTGCFCTTVFNHSTALPLFNTVTLYS